MAVYFLVVGLAAGLLSLVDKAVGLPAFLAWLPATAAWTAYLLFGFVAARFLSGLATLRLTPIWRQSFWGCAWVVTSAVLAAAAAGAIVHAIDKGWSAANGWPGSLSGFATWSSVVALPRLTGAPIAALCDAIAWLAGRPAFLGACVALFAILLRLSRLRATMSDIMIADAAPGIFEICPRPLNLEKPSRTGRKIAIFCDGTSNSPDQTEDGEPASTNICRMYLALKKDEKQIGWYDPGVATDTSSESIRAKMVQTLLSQIGLGAPASFVGFWRKLRAMFEAATGLGITENVTQAYAAIARAYRPGDAIYLFGFSRGAYTARCVAGVIARCGLLRAENAALAPHVVALYRTRRDADQDVPIDPMLIHTKTADDGTQRVPAIPRIEMLGVFDTVGSLGVPMWGWWFNFRTFRNKALSTSPAPICENIYHALAMDERRAQFFPTLFDAPKSRAGEAAQNLTQVWFRGAHADIGGGYRRRGLSDITLKWMFEHAIAHHLTFDPRAVVAVGATANPLEIPHDEMERQLAWKAGGSWPRWHPVLGQTTAAPLPPSTLHATVAMRSAALTALGRRDLLVPAPHKPITFGAGASRQWNDSGIVIEAGATYRISAEPGHLWRDAACPPCGPDGQDPGFSFADLMRRAGSCFKRLPNEKYMTLCVTIAHPRDWPLFEYGLGRLLRYLLIRDPIELRTQVAPIGRDMAHWNPVYIRNDAESGLLHTFANDLWLTDANNAGALKLRVERVAPLTPGTPHWVLRADGGWSPPAKS